MKRGEKWLKQLNSIDWYFIPRAFSCLIWVFFVVFMALIGLNVALQSPPYNHFSDFIEKFGELYIWPLVVFSFMLIFYRPISDFFMNLASVANRASIEIGGVKWTPIDLDTVIVDREILKIWVNIIVADGVYKDEEMKLLQETSLDMEDDLEKLHPRAKRKVLREAIRMAAMDREIHQKELDIIRGHARELGFDILEIDEMVILKCVRTGYKPPEDLAIEVEKRRNELVNHP